jgi:Kef-type K+ transport system membrane component KefB
MKKNEIPKIIIYISTILLATSMASISYAILHFNGDSSIKIGVAFIISSIFFLASIIASLSSLYTESSRIKEEVHVTVAIIIFILGCIFYLLVALSILYRV